jgi:hypothetical protein
VSSGNCVYILHTVVDEIYSLCICQFISQFPSYWSPQVNCVVGFAVGHSKRWYILPQWSCGGTSMLFPCVSYKTIREHWPNNVFDVSSGNCVYILHTVVDEIYSLCICQFISQFISASCLMWFCKSCSVYPRTICIVQSLVYMWISQLSPRDHYTYTVGSGKILHNFCCFCIIGQCSRTGNLLK